MKVIRLLIKGNIKYYNKYVFSMLFSILLSSALMTGISSMIYSNEKYSIEQNRTSKGDYHYRLLLDKAHYEKFSNCLDEEGFKIDKFGIYKKIKMEETPFMISFVYANEDYLNILSEKFIEGHYPASQDEVALSVEGLMNLRVQPQIGQPININQRKYILSGIISESSLIDTNSLEIFVYDDATIESEEIYAYIKFDEQFSVKEQKEAFCKVMGLPKKALKPHYEITQYFGDKAPSSLFSLLKEGLRERELNFTGVLLLLKDTTSISVSVIIIVFGVFSAFILYSIFNVSMLKRIKYYEILQALGANFRHIYLSIVGEIVLLLAIGYPLGAICGNFVSKYVYPIFSKNNGELGSYEVQYLINWSAVVRGAVVFVLLSIFISAAVVLKIRRRNKKKNKSKISKIKKGSRERNLREKKLSSKIIFRITFEKRGMFAGIVISLSLGPVLFLATNYIIENTKISNELTLKADDGLGSDYQVYLETTDLSEGISKKVFEDLEAIKGVKEIHPVSYFFGEVQLKENRLLWKSYFPEIAGDEDFKQSPRLLEFFNGICVKNDGGYGLKSNIYGYDSGMLRAIEDYIIEGEINYHDMYEENQVILRVLEGGQNNYGGIDIHPGDKIKVRVPASLNLPSDVVKFNCNNEWYVEKEFLVCATVKRVMAKNQYFIGDSGLDLVMTNRQMEEEFGLNGYNIISINQENDNISLIDSILDKTREIDRCLTKDYTQQIRTANSILKNKAAILYVITIIILFISLLHIVNCISYLIIEREYEFGVLRAIGIEDLQLTKMILTQGIIYGLTACAITFWGYKATEIVLRYILESIYSYISILQPINIWLFIGVICINLFVAMVSMIVPIRHIVSETIIKQINK